MKKYYGLLFFVLLLLCAPLHAQENGITITEIAASPGSGHEWVEVYNSGVASISFEGWVFWEADTNHGLSVHSGTFVLSPGEFGIIAQNAEQFVHDFPHYAGAVFDSSWSSLKESGELIGLKDAAGIVIEEFAYPPAPDAFLQRKSVSLPGSDAGNWVEGEATPGALLAEAQSQDNQEAAAGQEQEQEILQQENTQAPSSTPQENATVSASPVHYFWGNVWINELVSDPSVGEPEWVELVSNKSDRINLSGWHLRDASGSKTPLQGTLEAYGFVVVEGIKGSLNNKQETLTLIDHQDNVIDEIQYGTSATAAPKKGEALARRVSEVQTADAAKAFAITTTITKGAPNHIISALQQQARVPASPAAALSEKQSMSSSTQALNTTSTPRAGTSNEGKLLDTYEYKHGALRVQVQVWDSGTSGTTTFYEPRMFAQDHDWCLQVMTTLQTMQAAQTTGDSASDSDEGESLNSGNRADASAQYATVIQSIVQAKNDSKHTVSGVVTAAVGELNDRYFYLQDASGGIQVYQHDKAFPALHSGDTVRVSGVRSTVAQQPRLKVQEKNSITVVSRSTPLQAKVVQTLQHAMVGTLVQVQGVIVERTSGKLVLANSAGEVNVLLRKQAAETMGGIEEADEVRVTGIVSQYNEALRLEPRSGNDVELVLKGALGASTAAAGQKSTPVASSSTLLSADDSLSAIKRALIIPALLAAVAVAYLLFAPSKEQKSVALAKE